MGETSEVAVVKVGRTTFVCYVGDFGITFSVRGSRVHVSPYGAGMQPCLRAVVLAKVAAGDFTVRS